jgi:hypothetical protein
MRKNMNTGKYYRVSEINRSKGVIFIESVKPIEDTDLSRTFREIEIVHYKKIRKPWRVICKDSFGLDYEVSLDTTKWPNSYLNWDRRYNPDVKITRWHGHAWDTLKGIQ